VRVAREQVAHIRRASRPRAKPRRARCAASNATSRAASGVCSPSHRSNPNKPPQASPPTRRPSQSRPRTRRPSQSPLPFQNAQLPVERSTARSPGRSRWSASPSHLAPPLPAASAAALCGPLPHAARTAVRPRLPQIDAIRTDGGPTDANQRVLRRPAALDQRAATYHTPRSAPIADPHPVQPPSPTHSETRK
jgi:hypothetical protein